MAGKNCDKDNLKEVLEELKRRAKREKDFEELAVAITVLSSIAPKKKRFPELLRTLFPREVSLYKVGFTQKVSRKAKQREKPKRLYTFLRNEEFGSQQNSERKLRIVPIFRYWSSGLNVR